MAAIPNQYSLSAVICNPRGLHARAASLVMQVSEQFEAQISIACNGHTADARSILDLLMLGAAMHAPVTITADGKDAEEAVKAIQNLIQSGFHEPH